MVFANLLFVALMGAVIGLSSPYFSPQELQDRFEDGQKYYALGDYDKAIAEYRMIPNIRDNFTIKVDEVNVEVDEFILPVRVAATYQLANSYNKQGIDKLRRSEFLEAEQNREEAQQRYAEALADLDSSLVYFRRVIADRRVDERTRVMAQYQMLQTNYQLKQYQQVIDQGRKLLDDFPNSGYEAATNYDIGWSQFELKQDREAIASFMQVLILSPSGWRSDNAFFQIGASYDRLEEYDKALEYLGRLIGRYDFSQTSQQELIEMNTLKLKGIVKETPRELVAKAQIKRGDIYAHQGKVDQALEAYGKVARDYSSETALVQNSYLRAAELIQKERGVGPAIAEYKHIIENVTNKVFQAQVQLTVARLLFEEGEYEKAAEEYRVFLKAYGDVAVRIGFARDKALFREAECYQALGKKLRPTDPGKARPYLDQAANLYQQVMQEYDSTPLRVDALFSLGLTQQLQGDNAGAKATLQQVVDQYPDHQVSPLALLQVARLGYEDGDLAGARATYESLLKKYPGTEMKNTTNMELGLTAKKMGDQAGAIAALAAVEPGWEQWPKVQVELAELHVGQQQYEQAKAVLGRALEQVQDPQLQGQLHFISAKIDFVRNNYRGTIAELDQVLERSPNQELVENALFTRGSAYYEVARQRDAAGDSSGARTHYEAGLADLKRLLEGHPSPQVRDSAFRTLGASMIRLQRQGEAARYYEQLIAASPDPQERAAFQMLLTELFYDMQDWEQSQTQARKLLAMDFEDDNKTGTSRNERAHSIIANALMQQQKFAESAQAFDVGLKQFPRSGESANFAFSKSFAEFNDRDFQAAIKSFKYYIDAFPGDRNQVHANYYLAHSYQALTEFKDAAASFRSVAERFPNSSYEEECLFLWGENFYNERMLDEAIKGYQRLLPRYPEGQYAAPSLYSLGWCFLNQEKMDQGIGYMHDLVKRFPRSELAPKAQLTIGDYYYNKAQHDQALEAYQLLLKEYPGTAEAEKSKALVNELMDLRASADYAEAMKLLEAEKYQEVLVALREIVEKYPGTYTELAAYCNLGLIYERIGDWRKSAENYAKTLEKGGDNLESYDVVSFAKLHRDWIVKNKL